MDYFFLYLLGQDIRAVLGMCTLLFGVYILLSVAYNDIKQNKIIPPSAASITVFFFIGFMALITPSQDSLKYMGSYYVGKQAIQSETTQKLITILNQRLDKEIKDNLPR